MISKILVHYQCSDQKKYFLLKVAISTRRDKRELVHALAIPTNKQITNLKEFIYDKFEYKEFLLEAKEFLNLLYQGGETGSIEIEGFRIPFEKNPQVEEYFIPRISSEYKNIQNPYKIFRIRIAGESYAYGSLSHPNLPNYSSFYAFIKEHMSYDFNPDNTVNFNVIFPMDRGSISNLKIKWHRLIFNVEGLLDNLGYTYYIKTDKEEKRNDAKIKANKKNKIKFKGKLMELQLNLWHGEKQIDYVNTRHINPKFLSRSSYWYPKVDNVPKKSLFKRIFTNPWTRGIGTGVVVGIILYYIF